MMEDGRALLERLQSGTWRSIKGLKPKKLSSTYCEVMDLSITTDGGWIDIRSHDRKHPDPMDELHSLRIHEELELTREWWTPQPGWEIVELTEVWTTPVLERLRRPPREIRYFSRERYRLPSKSAETLLDMCEAIEISAMPERQPKLVIAVDTFIVAVVKIALGEKEQASILRGLTEIDPTNWRSAWA